MRKLLLILVLCLGLQKAAPAQYYFNNRETLHSLGATLTSVVPRDGKYYCTGVCVDSINYIGGGSAYIIRGVKFAIFDSVGQLIRDTVYQEEGKNLYAWNNSLYPMPDKGFVYALGQDIDTNGIARMMIVRYDSMGDVEWTKEYDVPFCGGGIFYRIIDMKPTGTGEWLTLATQSCYINGNSGLNQADMVLTKLDSNFNEEWSRQYGDPTNDDGAGKILIDPDGYVLGGCFTNLNLTHTNYTYRAELIKTDTAGNQQWKWLSDGSKKISTVVSMDLIRSRDGGYIYCGQGDGIETPAGGGWDEIDFIGWVEKIDSNRNEVWGRRYGAITYNTGFNVIKETDSGDLYLFGYKYFFAQNPTNTGDFHTKGWLMHLDANGDSVDERTYYKVSSCNDENTFYDAKPTTDGGWVMVGESRDDCGTRTFPSQQGWIVKVDSNGCLGPNDPQCWPVGVPKVVKQDNFKLYPNPGKGNFTLSSPGLYRGELRIYNVMGQEVYSARISSARQTFSIDVPAGVYVAELRDDDGGRYVQRLVVER